METQTCKYYTNSNNLSDGSEEEYIRNLVTINQQTIIPLHCIYLKDQERWKQTLPYQPTIVLPTRIWQYSV